MGCILYQLLFKRHPFHNATIITDNWILPRGRTKKEPLITLLCECLQLLPADRPTAASLVTCFDAVAEGNPLPKRDFGTRPAVAVVPASSRSGTKVVAASPRASPAAVAAPPADCAGIKLRATVQRGAQGLGFALNSDNCVATLVEGGQAEEDGLLELGDTILAVDGVLLEGRPMGEVITRGNHSYEFLLLRRDPAIQVRVPLFRSCACHKIVVYCFSSGATTFWTAGEPREAACRQPGPRGSGQTAAVAPTRRQTRCQWPRTGHERLQRAEESNRVANRIAPRSERTVALVQ